MSSGPVNTISGCCFWYEGNNLSLTNGAFVYGWNDLSGSGNNLTPSASSTTFAPTYHSNVLNGYPTVRFSGSNYLQTTSVNPALDLSGSGMTVFTVYATTGTYQQTILSNDAGLAQTDINFVVGTSGTFQFTSANVSTSTTINFTSGIPANQFILRYDRFDQNGNFYFGYFGHDVGSGVASLYDGNGNYFLRVGHSNSFGFTQNFQGDIAEIVGYNRPLTTLEVSQVNQYLYSKYFTSSFTPDQVGGLIVWLAANSGIGSLTDGSNVTFWHDLSGQGNDFSFPSASSTWNFPRLYNNVINGYPTVRFSNSGNLACISDTNIRLSDDNFACFCVYSTTSNSYQPIIANDGPAEGPQINFLVGTSGTYVFSYNYNQNEVLGSGTPTNQFILRADRFRASDSEFLFEYFGVPIGSGSFSLDTSGQDTYIGYSTAAGYTNYFHGDLAEVIIYNNPIAESGASLVTQYLKNKYFSGSGITPPPNPPFVQPTDLSGCFAWYRSTSIGVTGVDGSQVQYWPDDSGSGNNLTIDLSNSGLWVFPTFYRNQINIYPTVRFNNGSYYSYLYGGVNPANIFNSGDFTAFCVFNTIDGTDEQSIYSMYDNAVGRIILNIGLNESGSNSFYYSYDNTGEDFISTGSVYTPGTFVIRSDRFKPNGEYLFGAYGVDIASGITSTYPSNNRFMTVGGIYGLSRAYIGDVAEIICYSRQLSDYEFSEVNSYLLQKYQPGNVGVADLFMRGSTNSGIYKSVPLYSAGVPSSTYNNIPLYLINSTQGYATTPLYIYNATPTTLSGVAVYFDSDYLSPMFAQADYFDLGGFTVPGYTTNAGGISLYVGSSSFITKSTTLSVSGSTGSLSGSIDLYLATTSGSSYASNLYIHGKSQLTGGTPLYTQAAQQQFPHITLYTAAITGLHSPLGLYVTGLAPILIQKSVSLFTNSSHAGISGLYQPIDLYLEAGSIFTSMPLYLGAAPINTNPSGSMPLFVGSQPSGNPVGTTTLYIANEVSEFQSPLKRLFISGLGASNSSFAGALPFQSTLFPLYLQNNGIAPTGFASYQEYFQYNYMSNYFQTDYFDYVGVSGLPVSSGFFAGNSFSMYIGGVSLTGVSTDLYVKGTSPTTVTSGINLVLHGIGQSGNYISIYTRGF